MKEKVCLKLWFHFVSIVFIIMLATAVIMSFMLVLLFRLGRINIDSGRPHMFLISLLFLSVIVGMGISMFVAHKILNPITIISKVSNEVAKGNFNIKLEENSRIEEIRELTRNFNIMVQELSGIETLRNDFVVNVSHEFKTPIAAIEGYATLLQENSLSDTERKEYTQMILDSSRQLATLSGNILTLSKLEVQETVLEKKPYRLDEQIRQAILLLESRWNAKEHDLQIDMPCITYHGNETLLMQVWMNIIGNAVKFTPNGESIKIQLSSNEKNVTVSISDTGCGIDETSINHIFDKFYQSDATRKSEGNGLGLALVKRIIELSGGEIKVKSSKGKGSKFTIILPNSY